MKTKTVSIKACAEVLPGFSTKVAVDHDPKGSHQLIVAKHLPEEGPYIYREEHSNLIRPDRSVEKYLLAPGDILFMSRGVWNRAVLLEQIREPSIAPISFYILRPKEIVIPQYLSWCLNQIPMQARIAEIRTGAGTPLVNRRAFSDMEIALPPLALQEKIAALADLLYREKRLMSEMTEEVDRLHRATGQILLKRIENQAIVKD
jgi:hypothetical protein